MATTKSISPEKVAKYWPMMTAILICAATIGGGWVRLQSIEKQIEVHQRFFRTIAVNQYLMCRQLNKHASAADDKLKCAYPEE